MINIISHDSGGAELLSSWIAENPNKKYFYSLKGPAIKIFKKKIKNINKNNLKDNKSDCEKVIATTGSKFERNMIFKLYKKKKYLIIVLDHWINYKKRLFINNIMINPDEIWVFDKNAKLIAKKIFKCKINLKQNYYYLNCKKKFKNYKSRNKNKLLFICDPNPSKSKKTDMFTKYYNEKKIIRYIINYFDKDFIETKKIILRLHPNQYKRITYWKNYYLKHFSIFKNKIDFSKNNSLIQDLKKVKKVFGGNSAALDLTSYLGIKTYSIIIKKKISNNLSLLPKNKNLVSININNEY